MRIETTPRSMSWAIQVALACSIVVHGLVLAGFVYLGNKAQAESYVVDLIINEPEQKPEPAPTPEATPPPMATPKPTPAPLPPPNKQIQEQEQTKEPPKPVFGVTEESTVDGDSGVSVRVGNTLMKEMEDEFTDPNQVHPYAGAPPGVHEATELDRQPKVVNMVEPAYPPLARRAGKEGRVILRILITRDGKVVQVQVASGPGGNFGFEESAVEAVKKWRFEKPTISGQPVDVWATLPIRFTLEN